MVLVFLRENKITRKIRRPKTEFRESGFLFLIKLILKKEEKMARKLYIARNVVRELLDQTKKEQPSKSEKEWDDNQGLVVILGDGGTEFFHPLPTGRGED